MVFLILDLFLVWKGKEKPRDTLNKLVLSPSIVVVLFLLDENTATETNITSLLVENRRGGLKVRDTHYKLQNTEERKLENPKI